MFNYRGDIVPKWVLEDSWCDISMIYAPGESRLIKLMAFPELSVFNLASILSSCHCGVVF
ncbi:hypothetical protein KSS87_009617 [Heliosperma pusillum]|nr:hypothetical protein KSS87_009617 [Heliosperma pusillum]